jgi:putative tryptophan/tyrosine transport system substrate-binding protein
MSKFQPSIIRRPFPTPNTFLSKENRRGDRMKRRDLIAGLLIAGATGRAHAQQTGKVYRIAIAHPSHPVAELSDKSSSPLIRAIFEELRQLRNLLVERYSGEGRAEHYPELARGIVSHDPDLVLAFADNLVLDFKTATATIPIVGVFADPVGGELVNFGVNRRIAATVQVL